MNMNKWMLLASLLIIVLAATLVLSQSPAQPVSTALCAEHGIADSLCTRCHPDLIPTFKQKGDWCAEHHLPESQCDLCHPELRKAVATGREGHGHAAGAGHDESGHVATAATGHEGHDHSAAPVDWCAEHRVPESQCTRCNPALEAAFKAKGDWCGGHGIPESHCYLCNPGIRFPEEALYTAAAQPAAPATPAVPDAPAAPAVDWCAEHRVPESQCTRCHPELVAQFKAKNDWCGGHGVPESHCYLCNPGIRFPQELEYGKTHAPQPETPAAEPKARPQTSLYRSNARNCATTDAVVQLASVQTADRIGLLIEPVSEAPLGETIEFPGEVEFDATAAYAVTSLVGGTLVRWLVQPGEPVQRGQLLAYIESIEGAGLKAEAAHAAAELALAKAEHERASQLAGSGLASPRELQEAETVYLRAQTDHRKAAAALKALGYSESDLHTLNGSDEIRIPLRARDNGVLVEQRVDLGAVLEAGESIGLIASTDKLWVEAQVRERELARLRVGQTVTVSSDGEGLNRCGGTITWVAQSVDPVTRMGRIRIEAEPNGSKLLAHQFVRVHVAASAAEGTVVVPVDAVQWEGCCNVVFVSETRDRFRPRKVQVQHATTGGYAVSGLQPGEHVVTRGSYLLKTELMKGNLGAGCCGVGA